MPRGNPNFVKGNKLSVGVNVGRKTEKQKQDIKQRARDRVLNIINKNKDKILKAQIEEAKGLYYVGEDKKIIYTKKPNTGMGEYLLNQLIGKPKESLEVTERKELLVDF